MQLSDAACHLAQYLPVVTFVNLRNTTIVKYGRLKFNGAWFCI